MLKALVPTLFEGVKRAFRINVSEQTEPETINDAAAKAIKIITRAVVLVALYKFFPEQFEQFFALIFQS